MTPTHANTNKRDQNEKSIVEFWRQMGGCYWKPMETKAGFDGILFHNGKAHIVEIKNGTRRWTLTKAEKETREAIERTGNEYHIIETTKDAARLIGLDIEEEIAICGNTIYTFDANSGRLLHKETNA